MIFTAKVCVSYGFCDTSMRAYVVIFATQVRVCCDSLSILWFSKWKSYVGGRAQNGSHSGSCITSRGTFQTAAGSLTQIYPLKKQEKNKNAISRKVRESET